jgi:hypothetical protein
MPNKFPLPGEAGSIVRETQTWLKKTFPSEEARFSMRFDVKAWVKHDLKKLVQVYRQSGATVVLQTYHWLKNRQYADQVNPAIREVAKEDHVLLLDTEILFPKPDSPAFQSYYSQEYGPIDSHPSEKGHEAIAKYVTDFLQENKLLP